ncbi:1644_t:CDS:2 [Rhizophagus irregularis]|nr:1644_t:CDS:2 [Rhizophagus irregularis]
MVHVVVKAAIKMPAGCGAEPRKLNDCQLKRFYRSTNPIFQDGENGLREELNIPNTSKEVNNNIEFNPINIVDDVLNTRLE